jgi:hypothetical protein
MSRRFHDPETDAWLRETVKDYARAGVGVNWLLQVGPEDMTEGFDTANIKITKDAPAWDLSTNVMTNLDLRSIRRAPVRVRADFDGTLVDVFQGREDGLARHENDYSTSFLASTPGSWLSKIALHAPVEYDRRSPRWVLRDALYRSPYYDRGNVHIAPFDTPQITRMDDTRFEDDAYPSDIIEAVREMVSFSHKDTPTRWGHRLREDVGTGAGQPITWVYDAHDDREMVERWVEPAPVSPEDQPTVVIAREYYDNGDRKIWQEAGVFNYGDKYPSPTIPKFLDFASNTNDPEEIELTAADAYRMAVEEARVYRQLEHTNSSVVSFNPYLWPDDVITFTSRAEITNRGFYQRSWRAVINGLAHDYQAPKLVTNLDYRCYLVAEARLPDPPIRLPGVTAAVLDFEEVMPLIKFTDKEVIFAPTATWALATDKEIIFSEEAPVTVTDREIVVDS